MIGLAFMVSPHTRGIRGRGTRLKRKATKKFSGALVAIICALFSIGLTLEGLSITIIGQDSLNLLAIIGLITGIMAIVVAVRLWSEGNKLQKYWKRKKTINERFRISARKGKKRSKKKSNKKSKKKKK